MFILSLLFLSILFQDNKKIKILYKKIKILYNISITRTPIINKLKLIIILAKTITINTKILHFQYPNNIKDFRHTKIKKSKSKVFLNM
jgi:hypothetical protein